MPENMSGSEIIEKMVEYMKVEKTSHRDRARRIYQLVYIQLKTHLYSDEIPVWLVWEYHHQDEDLTISQLRSIDLNHSLAQKHKKALENEAKIKGKKVYITIEGTRLNHLFAWKMVQRLKRDEE